MWMTNCPQRMRERYNNAWPIKTEFPAVGDGKRLKTVEPRPTAKDERIPLPPIADELTSTRMTSAEYDGDNPLTVPNATYCTTTCMGNICTTFCT
jgi:hypothetical protein